MVASCCVCAAEWSPNIQRSFHKFPKSDELKSKWWRAIGRIVNYKTAVVCSDHFSPKDFRPNTSSRTFLLPHAVPMPAANSFDYPKVIRDPIQSVGRICKETAKTGASYKKRPVKGNMVLNMKKKVIIPEVKKESEFLIKMEDVLIKEEPVIQDTPAFNRTPDHFLDHTYSKSSVYTVESNHREREAPADLNKKLPYSLTSSSEDPKRCRVYSDFGMFRKEDFASESGWKRFLQFVELTKMKLTCERKKNERLQNKINRIRSRQITKSTKN